jgi:hypothetical protein
MIEIKSNQIVTLSTFASSRATLRTASRVSRLATLDRLVAVVVVAPSRGKCGGAEIHSSSGFIHHR